MTSPARGFDRHRLHVLTSTVLDGTASHEQQEELTAILRESAEARDEYLMYVDQHGLLSQDLGAQIEFTRPQSSQSGFEDESGGQPSRRRWMMAAAAGTAVICCVAISVLMKTPESEPVPDMTFVTVTQLQDAVVNAQLQVGGRCGASTIRVESGFVGLTFDSGVEVTLQGPAEYELISDAVTHLHSGLMTATVPEGAEGFAVSTPTAEVVDLGTSFGIDVSNDGISNVSVFDGKVEVGALNTESRRLLVEGEAVTVGSDLEIREVGIDLVRYEKVWPVSSGIASSSDVFQFIPPWPKNIRFVESDSTIFVAREGYGVELVKSLPVNISEQGTYKRVDELTPTEIQAGQWIRSFILHYSPIENVGPRRARRVQGSITFNRPVIGLIVQQEELLASRGRFSRRNAAEMQVHRELDLRDHIAGDRITLSEDLRTVSVDLAAPGRSTDLIRVIVDDTRKRRPHRPRRRN